MNRALARIRKSRKAMWKKHLRHSRASCKFCKRLTLRSKRWAERKRS